jgi:hypothetical protein
VDKSTELGIDRSMQLLSELQKTLANYTRRTEQLTKELGKARHFTGRQHRQGLGATRGAFG